MNLFEVVLKNSIFIIFPLMLYLLYSVYASTLNLKKNHLFLDCALLSSCYLLIRFGTNIYYDFPLLLLDIPLLIAYQKNRWFSVAILSFVSIFYYYDQFNIPIVLLCLEYIIYCYIYVLLKMKKQDKNFNTLYSLLKIIMCYVFITYSSHIQFLNMNNYINFAIIMLVFYAIMNLIIYLFNHTNEVIRLHDLVKDAEEENRIKKSLFQITHEIKNPIAVCKGYLDMFDVNNLEHSRKYIPILKSEIVRVLFLLEDFLAITKVKIEKDIMDLNMLLEDTTSCLKPIFNTKNVHFEYDISDDEIYIHADYNRLKQILINILKNSKEAILDNEQGTIKLYSEVHPKEVKIIVEDDGVGMTEEELSKIKEAFFTTKQRGTGLGVHLANEIVISHGGTLEYFSKKYKGTKVIITIPIDLKEKYA